MMADMSAAHDAEEVPFRPPNEPIAARHPAVWIRLCGTWCSGWIRHWDRDGDRWLVFAEHDDPLGKPWPMMTLFRYDPKAFLPRDGSVPPV
jgi:hypothetical protein